MSAYPIVVAVAFVASLVFTPLLRAFVVRLGWFDVPVDRKVHSAPTPTFGGIALYVSLVAAFAAAMLLPSLRNTFRFSEAFGLLIGGLVVLVLGILDDHHDLPQLPRLAGQIFAAGVLYLSGIQMSFFWLPAIGTISLSPELSGVATILWIVLMMNAVNFIDGLDGLAAGLTAIAAGALYIYTTRLPQEFLGPDPLTPLVAVALFGACLGFLPYNFFPAKIFMGDTGAMPLGLFLAGATISLIGRFTGPGSAGGRLALPLIFTPVVFAALPVGNFLYVTLRRIAARQPIMAGERDEHIHYRLLELGHSHRRAVLIMYAWALMLAIGLVVAGTISWGRFVLALAAAVGTVLLLTLRPPPNGGARGGRVAPPETSEERESSPEEPASTPE